MMEGKDLGAIFDAHIKAEFVDRGRGRDNGYDDT